MNSPRKEKKNYDRCAVKGCDSRANINPNLHFHTFPKPNQQIVGITNAFGKVEKVDRLKAWKIALKINNVTRSTKVCSLHFKKSDYILPDYPAKKRCLKKIAVPFRNDKISKKRALRFEERLKRINKRQVTPSIASTKVIEEIPVTILDKKTHTNIHNEFKIKNEVIEDDVLPNEVTQNEAVQNEDTQNQFILNNVIQSTVNPVNNINPNNVCEAQWVPALFISPAKPAPLVIDFEMQVNFCSFCGNIQTDSELITATGIESFEVLNRILKLLENVVDDSQRRMKMSLKEKVIMTFVKLKHKMSFSFLALIFRCYTANHCKRIFSDTVKALCTGFKPVIVWPTRDEIRRNMPKSFESFKDITLLLDNSEVMVQRTSELYYLLLYQQKHLMLPKPNDLPIITICVPPDETCCSSASVSSPDILVQLNETE